MAKSSFHHSDDHLCNELQKWIAQYSQVFLITDSNVNEHVTPRILANLEKPELIDIIEVDPGEASKSIEVVAQIMHHLIDSRAGRDCLIVNLGGGVVTDLGGFIASTYKRGVAFIHIPTSLMGMCDASIGGKTGIDMQDVKNVIGSFAYPKAVLIQPNFISTLPRTHILSGFAEMVKHAVIADPQLFEALEAVQGENPDHLALFIERSTRIKEEIVMNDFLEEGQRKILNFGHTVGHALESFYMQKGFPISHGHAVALGMIVESRISYNFGWLDDADYQKIESLLNKYFSFPFSPDWFAVEHFLFQDKKNRNREVRFALSKNMGTCEWDIAIPLAEVRVALEESLNG
ncbi:MAG: 3-dehydroquinate synthase [Flavobacteriales bacterium]